MRAGQDTQQRQMCPPLVEADSGVTTEKGSTKEKDMFTDPDLYRYVAKQREHELIEDASRQRLARSLRRTRRGRWPDDGSTTR